MWGWCWGGPAIPPTPGTRVDWYCAGAQGAALTTARAETEAVRAVLHETEGKLGAVEAEVAALRRETVAAQAEKEELTLAARRSAVQRELFEVSVSKERYELFPVVLTPCMAVAVVTGERLQGAV